MLQRCDHKFQEDKSALRGDQVEGVVVQVSVQRVGLNLDDLGVVVGVDVAVVDRHALAAARVCSAAVAARAARQLQRPRALPPLAHTRHTSREGS